MKKLLVIIQFILTISCLVLGFMYLLGNNGLLNTLKIVAGVDLVFMSICNYLIHKNIKTTIIYGIVGIILIISGVLGVI